MERTGVGGSSNFDRSPVDTTRAAAGPIWRQYLRAVGPGLITGASDDDPSTIASFASAGARFGFGFLWCCLVTYPLMVAVQVTADRTALVTGQTLGELTFRRFQRRGRNVFFVLLTVHVLANTAVIAADLTAVGAGMNLLHAGPGWFWALLAGALVTVLIVSGSFTLIARLFKVLCLALASYLVVLFVIHVDWGEVIRHTLVPHVRLNREYMVLLVAVLGSTMPPYVFFWQSVHRLEELRDEPEGGEEPLPLKRRARSVAARKERTSAIDVTAGMSFAVVIMFAIMVSTAATIGLRHPRVLHSAADAAAALSPIAGGLATTLFALGIVSAGMLAIPVLAGAGSAALSGFLGMEWGFSRSVRQAPVFYALVVIGTVGGTALSVLGADPIKLLVGAAFTNGIASAPLMALLMVVSSDRSVMGEFRTGRVTRVAGWVGVVLMGGAATLSVAVTLFG